MMRLAVSHIAWSAAEEETVAQLLYSLGVRHIEVAPTRIWPNPLDVQEADVRAYRRFWEDRGITIVAMQSLLFGRSDSIFAPDEVVRLETVHYLAQIMSIAAGLGARRLVFGSPRNRQVGDLAGDVVATLAREFFRAIGDIATGLALTFCLEPNPKEYDCDFVTTVQEGVDLVTYIDHPGVRLNLDLGGMTLSREDLDTVIPSALPLTEHFHISEPFLEPIGTGHADHARASAVLHRHGYDQCVSIEMKAVTGISNAERVRDAIRFSQRLYSIAPLE